jgi:hypothetical protein
MSDESIELATSAQETADDYFAVVARFGDDWRVVKCPDSLQWIVQSRAGARWRGRSYTRTLDGLKRVLHRFLGDLDGIDRLRPPSLEKSEPFRKPNVVSEPADPGVSAADTLKQLDRTYWRIQDRRVSWDHELWLDNHRPGWRRLVEVADV